MPQTTVKTSGFKELDATLGTLPRATAKRNMDMTLDEAMDVISVPVQAGAPYKTGNLAQSLVEGKKLNKRQSRMNRPRFRAFTELHFGTTDPAGFLNEFGSARQGANPFFRSVWLAKKMVVLDRIKERLWHHVTNSVARASAKAKRDAMKR